MNTTTGAGLTSKARQNVNSEKLAKPIRPATIHGISSESEKRKNEKEETRKLAEEVEIEIDYGDNETELELVRKEANQITKIKELDRQIKETEKDIPVVTSTETPSPE